MEASSVAVGAWPPRGASPEGWAVFAGRVYGGMAPAPDGGPPLGEEQSPPMPSSMSFGEVMESLNPLQHLPGLGTIYREATGNAAPIPARILGATLLGGPMGFLGAVAGTMLEVSGFVGTLRAIAEGRDQPTAFLAWGQEPGPAAFARARAAYEEQARGNHA